MKKPKTLFDQAIEIMENQRGVVQFLIRNANTPQGEFFTMTTFPLKNKEHRNPLTASLYSDELLYTRLLLARELWNDGQEKYWKQGKFY